MAEAYKPEFILQMKTQKQDLKEPLCSDLVSGSLVGGSTIRLELKYI
jgi:hypothetical protein